MRAKDTREDAEPSAVEHLTAALIVIATAASYVLGWLIGRPWLVPILNTAASYPFMVAALRRGDVNVAIGRMLVWAAALAVGATLLSYARPSATDSLFLRGESYRIEMFRWVVTGVGAESTPSVFIPQQTGHAALFALLAIASGSLLAMPMGAVLMNYMGHYVGTLAAASRHPAVTMALGWHPWAVIRIVSFVVIGVVLSVPLLSLAGASRVSWRAARPLVAWALAGLVLDVVLKTLLAPAWHRLLLRVVGW